MYKYQYYQYKYDKYFSPKLPDVGSMMVSPGLRRPLFSASSTVRRLTRSLMLPPALKNSHLTTGWIGKNQLG